MTYAAGDQLERFRVVGVIGGGAMGTVLRAWDPQLERHVALKVLEHATAPPALATRRTVDLRGASDEPTDPLAEARVMAKLAHPNVVPIFELGCFGTRPFLVMELVDGENLRSHLATSKHPVAAIIDVFVQAGRGLAAAHAHGIVHRDFKPENVLVGTDGRVRVADFGIAGFTTPVPASAMTRVGAAATAGTPAYMAPELFRGEPPSVRSDIYAFCVALHEALTGERPTGAASSSLERAGVSPSIRAIVARGLLDDAAQRPHDMHEVLRALDPPRRRGAWFAAGGVAVAGAIAAIVLARGAGAAATDDCGAASALRGRWGEPERAALREGLVATKRPRAAADALTVIERLDDYAKRIGELRVETCRVRTPPDRRAARLGCLDRRTYELGALARALATATPELADTAVDRAHELDDLARCLDTKHTAVAPANAERIEQLTTRLAARHENLAEQVAALDEIAAEARTLGDAETEIQTRLQLGWALRRKDATRAAAEVDRAYQLALEIQDPDWTVRALGRVAVLAAQDKDGAAADAIIRIADAHLERPGVSQFARTRALYDLGLAIHAQNKGGAALARFTAALEGARLEQRRHHEMRVELRIGVSLQGIARPAEAAPHFERAVELARQSFGDGHPEVAYAMMWLSKTRRALGRVAEAIAVGEQSLAILAAALPANHSNVIESRNAVGISYLMAGRHADAVATLETSLAAAPPTDQNPIRDLRAKALEALVDAYVENGQPDKARALADAALAELRGYLTSDHLKIGLAHKAVASVALAQQRLDDAVAAIDLAQPILVKQLGPTDPYAIEMHQLRGRIALLRGDHAGAERHTRTAIALGLDGQRAPRTLVASYNDLALSLVRRGRGREALEPIERLLAILDKVEHRPVERAWGLLLREHARQLGGDPAFSAERAAEQLAIVETARHPEAATERRWLSQIARSGSTRIRR